MRFSPEAIAALQGARWLGELRQLRGVVEACCHAACDQAGEPAVQVVITGEHVRARLALEHAMYGAERSSDWDDQPTRHDLRQRPSLVDAAAPTSVNPRRLTARQLREALEAEGGNIERTASRLGIARRTLMGKMDRLGVDRAGRRRR